MERDSSTILARYLVGKDETAREIVDQYTTRLIALAKTRLSAKLQRRVDPEDIVQSVYRSFFRRADNHELALQRNGDLWRLLAGMTIKKSLGRVEYELARKRNPMSEESGSQVLDVMEKQPSPEEATIFIDEIKSFMGELRERDRKLLELRLQGESTELIAKELEVSEATVRRVLHKARSELERRLAAD